MSNKLPNGWKECKLGEIATIKTGKTNSVDAAADGVYPLFDRSKDVKRSSKYLFDCEAVIVPGEGKDFIPRYYKGKFDLHQRAYAVIPNEQVCDGRYCYYALLDGRSYFSLVAVGSTVMSLRLSTFESFDILLPPLPEQRAIASVLSSLDDKIDLLHRENKTLEAMAETLFRQWFIEEAEKGWKVIKLEKYVECVTGCSYKSIDLNPSNIALVTLKNFARDGSFRMDGFKEYTGDYKKSQIVKQGDLVVAHTDITQEGDIIGNPVLIINPGQYKTLVITMDLMKVESTTEWLSKEFLYYLFKTPDFKFHCLGCSNGTTVLHMSRNAIPSYELKIPNKEKVIAFTKRVRPIIEKKFTNIFQIRTLEKLRDTLLPKLMSGEVRVKYEEEEMASCRA
ncbi:restriction endonuclease subunit S [Acetomicrobium sp.]|uniref:restriction endonuclease subunit S n=1 Tax=Acetomicrobium sp. TaxID=1872099 RepID=UPI002B25ED29|nr:restriction endonuclease subunit S [Acetomicrobium sp.]